MSRAVALRPAARFGKASLVTLTCLIALLLVPFAAEVQAAPSPPGVIDNGTVQLGVRKQGHLNVPGGAPSNSAQTDVVGLRLLAGAYEGTSPGCTCEGWGVADAGSDPAVVAKANDDQGIENVVVDSFSANATSATSVVIVRRNGEPYMRVTHAYQPSLDSPFLYEAVVTVEPLQLGGIEDLRYTRAIDWDAEPTPFNEYVTNVSGNADNLIYMSNNGFADTNPLGERDSGEIDPFVEGDAVDLGPSDHGVIFDFGFGSVPFGSQRSFKMFYGAAPTTAEMTDALEDAEVETFSLGKNSLPSGLPTGAPAVYAIGYADVGGDPVIPADAPKAVITSEHATGTTSDAITIEFAPADENEETTFTCSLDDDPEAPCTSSVAFTGLDEGWHSFRVWAELEGVKQLFPTTLGWKIDTTAPELAWDETPGSSSDDATPYFKWYDENGANSELSFLCSLNEGAAVPCMSPFEPHLNTVGEQTLSVTATDLAGNTTAEPLEYTWEFTGIGSFQFQNLPPETSSSDYAYFSFTIPTGLTADCRLTGPGQAGNWEDCDDGEYQKHALDEGEHLFEVQLFDGEGPVEEGLHSASFTVDITAPEVAILNDFPTPVTGFPIELAFTVSEPVDELECRLRDSNYESIRSEEGCDSPWLIDELSDGRYFVSVEAEDFAGNEGSAVKSFWVGDNFYGLFFDSAPPWWGPGTNADFLIEADDFDIEELTLTCSLDGAEFSVCSTNESFVDLEPGSHTFTVRADGERGIQEITHNWTISDTLMSQFVLTPDLFSDESDAYFEYDSAGDVDHIKCRLDSGAWEICDLHVHEISGLLDGQHTFAIRAFDEGGASQAGETSYTWTVDTKRPRVSTNIPTTLAALPFNALITVDEPVAKLRCELDEGPTINNCTQLELDGLDDGWHELEIEVEDLAGNWDEDTIGFYVQLGAPVAEITTNVNRYYQSAPDLSIAFTLSGPNATAECRFNGSDWSACTSPVAISHLSQEMGDQEFEVRAVGAEMTQAEPDSREWRVNPKPLQVHFYDTPDPWTSSTSANFEFESDEINESDMDYTCQLDALPAVPCKWETSFSGLALGQHRFKVVGTYEGITEEIEFEWVISELPGTLLTTKPNKFTNSTNAYFEWNTAGTNDGVECRLDDADWAPCNDDIEFNDLEDGTYQFELRATLEEATQDPVTSWTWTVDTQAPVLSLGTVASPITALPYAVPMTAEDADSELKGQCSLDDGPWADCSYPLEVSGLVNGTYELEYRVADRAGNGSDTQLIELNVQLADPPGEPPVGPPTGPGDGSNGANTKPLLSKLKKPSKGVAKVPYTCKTTICKISATVTIGKKKYKLKSVSVDAGNKSIKLKFSKSLKKALAKKKRKKATLKVTISGGGTATKTVKF